MENCIFICVFFPSSTLWNKYLTNACQHGPKPSTWLHDGPTCRKAQGKYLFSLRHIPMYQIHGLRTPNEPFFSLKFRIFGLGQTNWANLGAFYLGYFWPNYQYYTSLGTVSFLSVSNKSLYPHSKYLIGVGI